MGAGDIAEGREDDEGRGWCARRPQPRVRVRTPRAVSRVPTPLLTHTRTPSPSSSCCPVARPRFSGARSRAASSELIVRLTANPRLHGRLEALPPKMLCLSSDAPTTEVEMHGGALLTRVEEVTQLIESATFTGKGDKPKVVALYKEYVTRIATTLQATLTVSTATEEVQLPPMPASRTNKTMRAWHLEVLRAEHATIADALSGKRLDPLEDCVRIAVEGVDASGRPLAVRDAEGSSPSSSASGGAPCSPPAPPPARRGSCRRSSSMR